MPKDKRRIGDQNTLETARSMLRDIRDEAPNCRLIGQIRKPGLLVLPSNKIIPSPTKGSMYTVEFAQCEPQGCSVATAFLADGMLHNIDTTYVKPEEGLTTTLIVSINGVTAISYGFYDQNTNAIMVRTHEIPASDDSAKTREMRVTARILKIKHQAKTAALGCLAIVGALGALACCGGALKGCETHDVNDETEVTDGEDQ